MPSFLAGLWGYLAASILGALLASPITYYIVHNANAPVIAKLQHDLDASRLAQVQNQYDIVNQSLATLTGFINQMHVASADYQSNLDTIAAQFAAINRALKDAEHKAPLPSDCRPDLDRLRDLSTAVAAANIKGAGSASP